MIKPVGPRLLVKPFKQEQVDDVLAAAKQFGFVIVNRSEEHTSELQSQR